MIFSTIKLVCRQGLLLMSQRPSLTTQKSTQKQLVCYQPRVTFDLTFHVLPSELNYTRWVAEADATVNGRVPALTLAVTQHTRAPTATLVGTRLFRDVQRRDQVPFRARLVV